MAAVLANMIAYHRLSPEDLATHVRAYVEEVAKRYVPLRVEQLRWCAAPAQWSVGQCLHHLVVTDRLYLDRLQTVIDSARERGPWSDGPYRGGGFGRWFTSQVGPQVARRFRVPRALAPQPASMVAADIAETFIQSARRLLTLVDEARGLHLNRIRIGWPLVPFVRIRAIDALRAIVAHDRRHLDQAQRVTQAVGFSDTTYGAPS